MHPYVRPELIRPGETSRLFNLDMESVIDGDDLASAGAIVQESSDSIDGPWVASTALTIGMPTVGPKDGATRKTLVQVRITAPAAAANKFYRLTASASGSYATPHVEPFYLECRL